MTGGRVMQIGKETAAQLIVKETHRPSTPEEIEAHLAHEASTRSQNRRIDLASEGRAEVQCVRLIR